jgi:hypothetical protein
MADPDNAEYARRLIAAHCPELAGAAAGYAQQSVSSVSDSDAFTAISAEIADLLQAMEERLDALERAVQRG